MNPADLDLCLRLKLGRQLQAHPEQAQQIVKEAHQQWLSTFGLEPAPDLPLSEMGHYRRARALVG
jgi:hypothetical protein